MNVVGISGTPRKDGNSDILLQYALEPFREQGWQTRHIRLLELSISPCLACGECDTRNTCVIDDDMHQIYEAYRHCDAGRKRAAGGDQAACVNGHSRQIPAASVSAGALVSSTGVIGGKQSLSRRQQKRSLFLGGGSRILVAEE